MGGNALSNTFTERKNRADYTRIVTEVRELLEPFVYRSADIPAYREKESFGDADILIIPKVAEDLRHTFFAKLVKKPNEIVKNGNVYSFDYQNFQIDLIVCDHDNYETSYNYFSYNDLGNLIGRIAHKMGLKYGHHGLSYPIKLSDSESLGDVIISTNQNEILSFFGYSYKRFTQGFNTLEDIFNFVVSSRYFNKDIFDFEELNHTNRTRNRKRKTYCEFLEWVQLQENLQQYNFATNKREYIPYICNHFGVDIYKQWRELWGQHLVRVNSNRKFSGLEISEITGKIGEELGNIIHKFRMSFSDKLINYPDFLLITPKSEVIEYFKNWYAAEITPVLPDAQ